MSLETVRVPVWDILVRIFHWSLVSMFALAWFTADEIDLVHSWAGYTIASLIFFRLVWGVIGTRYARFRNFSYGWKEVRAYLASLLTTNPKHYLGHNPAGGLMVFALLLSLAVLTFSGMAVFATEGQGPLANTVFAGWSGDWIEEIHELFANLVLFLVFIHVSGVLVSSLLHRENLIKAMVTGYKFTVKETTHEQ